MSLSSARGVYVIAPTPFLDDGRIDNDSVDRMTDFYLAAGVAGITVLGQMGEAPKLEQREALDVAQRVTRRSTGPVIVGVLAPGFAAMRSLARASMEAGAAGVMIAPPNTLRTDEQIAGYLRQASEAIGHKTNLEGLETLPSGQRLPHTDELFASDLMRRTMPELARQDARRLVIVDGPPLLARTEAPNLARLAGHVIVIVEADRTPQASVAEALTLEGCPRVSLMLNKVTRRASDRHGYGYGYGYGYGQRSS